MARLRYVLDDKGDFVLSGAGSEITEGMIRESRPKKKIVSNSPILDKDFLSVLVEDENINLLTDREFQAIVNSR